MMEQYRNTCNSFTTNIFPIPAFVCVVCFFIGLIFTTGAGEYWLKMFDSFAATIGLVLVALMEMISVIYVYGHEKFTKDIQDMTGIKPGPYWQLTWRFLAPIIMTAILIASIVDMVKKHPSYEAWIPDTVNLKLVIAETCNVFFSQGKATETVYPGWVLAVAVAMIAAGVLPIPMVFLLRRYQCLKMDINIHEGSIRRIDTTVSTKEMITDVDVSRNFLVRLLPANLTKIETHVVAN